MAEEKPEKGTEGNPLTREDVLQAIENNGGTANGLDLSGKVFENVIDLSELDLSRIKLHGTTLFRADFNGSRLDGAQFLNAKLQHATFNPTASGVVSLQQAIFRNADLTYAQFREADLTAASFQEQTWQSILPASLQGADFRGATLRLADFGGCRFYGTRFQGAYLSGVDIYHSDSHLGDADWGNYVLGEETRKDELHFAETVYRQLKQWHTNAGMYEVAGKFFYREQEAKRKAVKAGIASTLKGTGVKGVLRVLRKQKRYIWNLFLLWTYRLLCGYGERPLLVVGWAASVLLLFAAIYFFVGSIWSCSAFWGALYFSAVSFTALGYGGWVNPTNDAIRALGAIESFIGVFSIALFLVTFIRKMTR